LVLRDLLVEAEEKERGIIGRYGEREISTPIKSKLRTLRHPIRRAKLGWRHAVGDVKVHFGKRTVAGQEKREGEWEAKKYEQKRRFAKTGKIPAKTKEDPKGMEMPK
jgi:hypothetical protein